jgi:hypothetical protein
MWRGEDGLLNTNSFADPVAALGPALGLVEDEAVATGAERLSVELEGMADLLCAELFAEDWDPAEEVEYERVWLPDEIVEAAMVAGPDSIADLLVAVPLRWRLDVLMVVADHVDSLWDEGD